MCLDKIIIIIKVCVSIDLANFILGFSRKEPVPFQVVVLLGSQMWTGFGATDSIRGLARSHQ